MVIVRLKGGLGNQLFQVAAGFSLANLLNTNCVFDLSSFSIKQATSLELNHFNLNFNAVKAKELRKLLLFPRLYKLAPRLFSFFSDKIYREASFSFYSAFFDLKSPVYIDGYFQSEKYFRNIRSEVCSFFTVRNEFVDHLHLLRRQIASCQSVALHIRRGDYLLKKNYSVHGVLPAQYYQNAIDYLLKHSSFDKIYIFSDDISWVKDNLFISSEHEFISGKTKTAIEDFYLMSLCKHNIVANSSFSWWAAWLNQNPDKIVIAPQKWFATNKLSDLDLVPETWVRI